MFTYGGRPELHVHPRRLPEGLPDDGLSPLLEDEPLDGREVQAGPAAGLHPQRLLPRVPGPELPPLQEAEHVEGCQLQRGPEAKYNTTG